MTLTELIIEEFDFEMSNTRTTLGLIPEDKLNWKPHEKSYSFAELGTHIGNLLNWATGIVEENSFNISASENNAEERKSFNACKEILNNFDVKAQNAHDKILNLTDEKLAKSWTLLEGEKILFTLPRYFVLRQFVINHVIHHRAQLTVYLRLNNIPLPNLYGPTADE